MSDSSFITIVVGVAVFAVSQGVLKLMLEPVVLCRKVRANIASCILFHKPKITNAHPDQAVSEELKTLSAALRAIVSEILCYKALSRIGIFGIPSMENVLEACRELNGLAHRMSLASQQAARTVDWPAENTKAIQRVGELLGINLHS